MLGADQRRKRGLAGWGARRHSQANADPYTDADANGDSLSTDKFLGPRHNL